MEYHFVCEDNSGIRIDKFINEQIPDLSRSYIQQLIKEYHVLVNDSPCKANYKCKINDRIDIEYEETKELDVIPENIPLDIVYEDDSIIIINKPKQMVVHPSAGHETGTLVNALLYHCKDSLSSINGVVRPGIVHRIDKNTSGLLIVAKNDIAHQGLAEQIKTHSFTREYEAIATGHFKDLTGTINAPIGRHPIDRKKMTVTDKNSKDAITHYEVVRQFANTAHLYLQLETGRTHQIRVHLAYIGHAIYGDDVYGKAVKGTQGQCLHARKIGFIHPVTGEYLEFTAPAPEYFQKLLKRMETM